MNARIEEEHKDQSTSHHFKFERKIGLAEIISAIALLISIITPFLIYTYFQPRVEENRIILQEIRNRPRLNTSKLEKSGSGKIKVSRFEIKNIGQFPAEEIQVMIRTTDRLLAKGNAKEAALRQHVYVYPDLQFEIRQDADVIRLTMKRPLISDGVLAVWIFEVPDEVSVQTTYGDLIRVYSPRDL